MEQLQILEQQAESSAAERARLEKLVAGLTKEVDALKTERATVTERMSSLPPTEASRSSSPPETIDLTQGNLAEVGRWPSTFSGTALYRWS